MLKGNNTTQCFFGTWTGMTPWCKEGEMGATQVKLLTATCAVLSVYCPFPGFLDHGKILLISRTGLYEYRSPWKTACTGASRNDEFAGRMFARSAMVARSCSSVTEVTP